MHVISAIILVLWLSALGRTILNLVLLPKLFALARPLREPLVSVVIPARNESLVIEKTVRAFLAQDYPRLEIIVVNDRSDDSTGEILAAIRDDRLIVIDAEETPSGWLGKPWALEQGARRASGELLLFVDADLVYAPAAVRAAVSEIERDGASLITLFPFFEMHTFGEHVGMPQLPFVLTALPVWLFNRWQRPRLALGGGSGNLIRREALESVGFFSPLRDSVIDDVALSRQVRKSGGRTVAVRAERLVRLRMYRGAGAIIEGFTKNFFVALGRSYIAAAMFLLFFVVAHLLPFALALTGVRLAIATVATIIITRLVLFGALGYSLWNAVLLHPLMSLLWIWILIRSVWITGIRKEVRWRGRVYDAGQTRFGGDR